MSAQPENFYEGGTLEASPVFRDGVMLINQERVAYAGLLGAPGRRNFGALTIYVSFDRPFRFRVREGLWQTGRLAVVSPYECHQISSDDRHIGTLMVEPENVELSLLPHFLQFSGIIASPEVPLMQMRQGFERLQRREVNPTVEEFDLIFFGAPLTGRSIDHRIAAIAERICRRPFEVNDARSNAALAQLSFSRFVHLFSTDIGVSFRRYRAWKRARHLLAHVNLGKSLTDVALDLGYPDSTHFSHSIRNIFGLKPKDIVAGSRRLAVIAPAPVKSASHPDRRYSL